MKVRDSISKKDHSNLTNAYGRLFSELYDAAENEQRKQRENAQIRKERGVKIQKLITLFHQTFVSSHEIIEALEPTFKKWEEQRFNKEIPNAMMQMKTGMETNGFQEEWLIWESIVSKEFPKA